MALALKNNALPTAYYTASNRNRLLNDELERSQKRNVFSICKHTVQKSARKERRKTAKTPISRTPSSDSKPGPPK
jgi:hypothetical protein